jgi:hypothetical protein
MIIFKIFKGSSKKDCCNMTIKPAEEKNEQSQDCCETSFETCCN